MRTATSAVLFAALAPLLAAQSQADTARAILRDTPLIDGHNDLAENLFFRFQSKWDHVDLRRGTGSLLPPLQTDIPRMRKGGMGGTFFAAFVPAEVPGPVAVQQLLEQLDAMHRMVERNPGDLALATTAEEVLANHRSGKISVLLGIENGSALGGSLATLRMAHRLGARYVTLTHVRNNDLADAAPWPGVGDVAPRHHGLSPFGREVVREMNRLGMLVDLSHTSDETMKAALELSQAPVIFSHTGARALCDTSRNVPDDVLHMVKARRGLVMVYFVTFALTNPSWDFYQNQGAAERARLRALYPGDHDRVSREFEVWKREHKPPRVTVKDVADHIDHIRKVAGIDAVGLGSDFDGSDAFAEGLEDTGCYPSLLVELLGRGYTPDEVRKIVGGNLLRVMREARDVAERLQKERPASEVRFQDLAAAGR